ncbi:MAG: 3-dehydroquinate synthase, partial [Eubacterium sp.]|nr:3-dehydroquinate synthase [Eubacterium sp.]
PEVCEHISEKNCAVKYKVVMKDEKEKNLREILNLGHTVGRAIETVSNYQLLHGEAVSIGMAAQVKLGCKLGFLTEEQRDRVIALYEKSGLPVSIPEYIDREALVKKLYTDKKVRDGKIRMVFQRGIGAVMNFGDEVYARPTTEEEIREVLLEM